MDLVWGFLVVGLGLGVWLDAAKSITTWDLVCLGGSEVAVAWCVSQSALQALQRN